MIRAALFAALILSGCASGSGALDHSAWIAAEAGGGVRFGQPYPTLVIDGGRVSGSASCNRFAGELTVGGASFDARNIAATEMACPDPIMEQERLFLALLDAAVTADWSQPGLLVLRTEDGRTLRLRSAPPQ